MAYRAAGISIARRSQDQWATEPHIPASQAEPGDLVFFAGADGTSTAPGHVGLVTGPSGCGKSTVARRLWPEQAARILDWPTDCSLLDVFPAGLSVKDVTGLLSAVGFSSSPGPVPSRA